MNTTQNDISADWEATGRTAGETPHRRILVAVDRTDKDESALRYAVALAGESGAAVRVMHVSAREVYSGKRYAMETADEAAALVSSAVSDLQVAGVPATGSVKVALVGREGASIVKEAIEWGADAIVLAAGPRRSWRRLFGRGVREQVLRYSAIPVVVAPASSALQSTRRIDSATKQEQRAA